VSPDQQFWLAVLAQLAALIVGLATLWLKVQDVHVTINHRMDELVTATAKASRAEGVASVTPPLPVQQPEAPSVPSSARWADPEHREWLEGGDQDIARLLDEVDRLRADLADCQKGWRYELDESAYRATLVRTTQSRT
jgi:hypothetical protein